MVKPPTEVVAAKRSLRKAMKALLSALDATTLAAESACVARQVVARDDWASASTVAAFCSMPSGELATRPLLEAAFAAKKRVFLPRVDDVKSRKMTMLEAYSLDDVDGFARSTWGIPEPPAGEGRADALDAGVDFVLVPGVAFDGGAGAWATARLLRHVVRGARGGRRRAPRVGVALADQLLPNSKIPDCPAAVPSEAHDEVLDAVVVAKRA
ncbi:5-formyltetrahydrofolate cyclo-ligase [Aureococcus anophagefferens]|nr:5-formyltetrahydrofolate cyclo-ligase [Aureococcus anophagefferens]